MATNSNGFWVPPEMMAALVAAMRHHGCGIVPNISGDLPWPVYDGAVVEASAETVKAHVYHTTTVLVPLELIQSVRENQNKGDTLT